MQQFTVPQFIDVEDKIIGPITARQFVIMLSGFMLMALCYRLFKFTFFLVACVLIFGVSGVFAFLKINGMPFHFFILNFVQTSKRPFLRVWNSRLQKELPVQDEKEQVPEEIPYFKPKPLTISHLAELALIVDTQGSFKGGQDININNDSDAAAASVPPAREEVLKTLEQT